MSRTEKFLDEALVDCVKEKAFDLQKTFAWAPVTVRKNYHSEKQKVLDY